jgi:hypothetical protein
VGVGVVDPGWCAGDAELEGVDWELSLAVGVGLDGRLTAVTSGDLKEIAKVGSSVVPGVGAGSSSMPLASAAAGTISDMRVCAASYTPCPSGAEPSYLGRDDQGCGPPDCHDDVAG